jgi:hypothetical protein
MVVRLQKDQFTAGDMVIAVRSRRKAKPTAGFYGAGASEMKRVIVGGSTMNPTSKVVSEDTYKKANETPNERFNRLVNEKVESIKHENEEKYIRQSVNYAANKILESTPISATVSDKGEETKDSDDYFDTEPVKEEVMLEDKVREEAQDVLHERAKQILKEIEEDMKQINLRRSY